MRLRLDARRRAGDALNNGWTAPEACSEHVGPAVAPTSPDAAAAPAEVRVSVVVPALNEALNLPHVLPRIPSQVSEVILVDGDSIDGTIEIARKLKPDVRVVHQDGHGKGNALACGFAAATGDIIVMLDADGSTRPEEISRFVETLRQGADFAKGSRFLAGGGSSDISRVRRMGNRSLALLVNLLYRTRYSDLCYGYNAFWTRVLPDIHVDCDGFEVETLINIKAARAGLRVVEVPSYEDRRLYGESKLHAVRDGLRVLRTILSQRYARPNGDRAGFDPDAVAIDLLASE